LNPSTNSETIIKTPQIFRVQEDPALLNGRSFGAPVLADSVYTRLSPWTKLLTLLWLR
jgi:hypothetical protein